jgi:hypothetical protein
MDIPLWPWMLWLFTVTWQPDFKLRNCTRQPYLAWDHHHLQDLTRCLATMVPSGYCPSPSSSGHVHVPACSPPSLRLSPESCCDRLDIYVKTHKSHQENDCYFRACNPGDITVEPCKMGATHLLQQSLGRVLAANPGLNGNWTNDFLSLKWQAIIPGPLLDAFPISSLPEEPHYSLKEW